MKTKLSLLAILTLAIPSLGQAAEQTTKMTPRIAWYGTLKSGLAAAERTGKPILLISAAPHCSGVSGIW